MLIKSDIFTQASGSLGGKTFLNTRGGMAIRARVIPTNPATARQQATRVTFGNLSSEWSLGLTQAQRDAWIAYAAQNPVVGKFGDPVLLSGQMMYIRLNGIRLGAAEATILRLLTVPSTSGLQTLAPVSAIPEDGAADIEVTFDDTEPWADLALTALIVYCTRKRRAGVQFTKGPWQLLGTVLGDATTPPTSPVMFANPFGETYAGDEKVGIRTILTKQDGRPSAVQFFDSTAV